MAGTSPAMTELGQDTRQFNLLGCANHFGHREETMSTTIKSLLVTSIALASFVVGLSGAASAAEPYGVWVRPSTGTQVSFYNCGGKLCGKIVAVKDESRKKEVGTVIMKGSVKSGDNKWEGDLLEADTGKIYTGVVTLEGPSALNLKGCVLMICKGETWTKVR
jgi:uncharacterized protein (DUF2147 family)